MKHLILQRVLRCFAEGRLFDERASASIFCLLSVAVWKLNAQPVKGRCPSRILCSFLQEIRRIAPVFLTALATDFVSYPPLRIEDEICISSYFVNSLMVLSFVAIVRFSGFLAELGAAMLLAFL